MDNIEIISPGKAQEFIDHWYDLADASHFWMRWRLHAFINQLTHLNIRLENPYRGIEIGCGRGVLKAQLEEKAAWAIDGVELDLSALKANPKGRGKLFLYDVFEKNKQFAAQYDFLILFDVLEHIQNPGEFLNACLFHLKPNGYLFINVPALQLYWSAYDIAAGHVRRYNKAALSAELGTACCQLLDIRYWGFCLQPLLLLRKLTTSAKQKTDDIIQKGFKPPMPFINKIFVALMHLESFSLKNPPSGTSILAIAQKK